MLSSIREWASFVRDIGLVLGIPVLITVGVGLYDLQIKANEAQIKTMEAQANLLKEVHEGRIKTLENHNTMMKEAQYDRSWSRLKAQKEIHEMEIDEYHQKISKLEKDGGNNQQIISELKAKLDSAERSADLFRSVLFMVDTQKEQAEKLATITMQYNDKIKTMEGLSNAERGAANLEGIINGNMK